MLQTTPLEFVIVLDGSLYLSKVPQASLVIHLLSLAIFPTSFADPTGTGSDVLALFGFVISISTDRAEMNKCAIADVGKISPLHWMGAASKGNM